MTSRERLPQRRAADTFSIEMDGRRFEASVGTDGAGRPREVFLKGGKSGTELDILLGDLGVAISIALQYGAPAEVLAHGFLRNADRSPAGVAAAAMDKVVETGPRVEPEDDTGGHR